MIAVIIAWVIGIGCIFLMKKIQPGGWIAYAIYGAAGTITTVKRMLSRNTPLMTRYSFDGKGGLTNETLYSAKKAKGEGYIPFKSSDDKMQDVTKYGGFTSVTLAV